MQRTIVRRCAAMLVLGERDVKLSLDLKECLEINRKAFLSEADETCFVPNRLGLTYPNHPTHQTTSSTSPIPQDWTLIKPAAYYGTTTKENNGTGDDDSVTMGLKVVSVRANNPSKELPLVPATTLLVHADTGIVDAMVSGTFLTIARTSAGPAIAVEAFQPMAENLVMFGAGAQAEYHIRLMQLALKTKFNRTIPNVTIVNRTLERAEALAHKLRQDFEAEASKIDIRVIALDDHLAVQSVLETADIVSTTTNSLKPLWSEAVQLKPGCLITGIGSYTPEMSEVNRVTVDRSHVLVDTPGALNVGDLKHLGVDPTTLRQKPNSASHPVCLLGTALANPERLNQPFSDDVAYKNSNVDCIFFKSVGTAIQDVLTSDLAVKRARLMGIGHHIDMTQ